MTRTPNLEAGRKSLRLLVTMRATGTTGLTAPVRTPRNTRNEAPFVKRSFYWLAASRFLDETDRMQSPASKPHRPRRSSCAEASLRAEMERVDRMTIEERVKAALSMGHRFSWIKAVAKQD